MVNIPVKTRQVGAMRPSKCGEKRMVTHTVDCLLQIKRGCIERQVETFCMLHETLHNQLI